ncbi:MAG TPA: hypothetical protein VMT98_03115 [Verrucomicrobiae bacterium]|nr:hypothetical protein [Verrucomicrobiae bacterium]
MAERNGSALLGVLVGALLVVLVGAAFLIANEKSHEDEATFVIKLPGAD